MTSPDSSAPVEVDINGLSTESDRKKRRPNQQSTPPSDPSGEHDDPWKQWVTGSQRNGDEK